jgi:hypothetical protein
MSERRIPPAGDPFTARQSGEPTHQRRLAELQDRLNHELMPDGERERVRDEILRLRREERA